LPKRPPIAATDRDKTLRANADARLVTPLVLSLLFVGHQLRNDLLELIA
jgi:hypothetical protein